MKAWRQRWKSLESRYTAFSRRERWMVAAALVVGPLLIGNALLVEPLSKRANLLQTGIARQQATLAELQTQIVVIGQQLQSDPDAARKAELAALQQAQDGLDKEIEGLGATLVKPEDMNGLLEHLLAKHSGLRLVSLKTLSPRSMLASLLGDGGKEGGKDGGKNGGKNAPERVFDLYQHGVEIRLEGNYGELMAYVGQIEQQKARLLVDRVNYRVIDYPRAEMAVTVYTLSSDRAWLSL